MMKDRIDGHSRGPRCCRSARRGVREGWLCNGGWIDFKSEEAGWLMVHGVVSWAGHASRCGKTHESYGTRGATSMRRWLRVGGWVGEGGSSGLPPLGLGFGAAAGFPGMLCACQVLGCIGRHRGRASGVGSARAGGPARVGRGGGAPLLCSLTYSGMQSSVSKGNSSPWR